MSKKSQADSKKNRKLRQPRNLEAQRPLNKPALSDIHITKPTDVAS
ncbi:MAG: hypothetical protein WCA00_01690 [Candidatus Acidiferrales bacterium]